VTAALEPGHEHADEDQCFPGLRRHACRFFGAAPVTDADAATRPSGDRITLAKGLIREFEGFRSHAYKCPAGTCTVGFGTTGAAVHFGMVISRDTAERWLDRDVRNTAIALEKIVRVPLSEKSWAAILSFAYNVGVGAFEQSTLEFLISQKRFNSAAEQFGRWVHSGDEKLPGLIRRRAAERALFLEGLK
jgi:lysozyme